MNITIPTETHAFHGVPTFLRARLAHASLGGRNAYYDAGRELGRHIEDLAPDTIGPKEWNHAIVEFGNLASHDKAAALTWLDQHYPRCMELVPARRRTRFHAGVVDMINEG